MNHVLDAQLVNPFVEAAYEVFSEGMELEVIQGSVAVRSSAMTTQEISVYIGISGEVHGQIFYGMSSRAAKQIASKMLGQRVRILNDLAQSAIKELGNMITGRAAAKLDDLYPNLTITPPTIVIGKDVLVSAAAVQRLYIILISEFGEIEINIAFKTEHIPDQVRITHIDETKTQSLI